MYNEMKLSSTDPQFLADTRPSLRQVKLSMRMPTNERTSSSCRSTHGREETIQLLTAHTWPYLTNVFLCQLGFLAQRGINEGSASVQELAAVLIRRDHANIAIFAICDVTASQLVKIFAG